MESGALTYLLRIFPLSTFVFPLAQLKCLCSYSTDFVDFGDKLSAFYDFNSYSQQALNYSLMLFFLCLKYMYLPIPISELCICFWSRDKAIFRCPPFV